MTGQEARTGHALGNVPRHAQRLEFIFVRRVDADHHQQQAFAHRPAAPWRTQFRPAGMPRPCRPVRPPGFACRRAAAHRRRTRRSRERWSWACSRAPSGRRRRNFQRVAVGRDEVVCVGANAESHIEPVGRRRKEISRLDHARCLARAQHHHGVVLDVQCCHGVGHGRGHDQGLRRHRHRAEQVDEMHAGLSRHPAAGLFSRSASRSSRHGIGRPRRRRTGTTGKAAAPRMPAARSSRACVPDGIPAAPRRTRRPRLPAMARSATSAAFSPQGFSIANGMRRSISVRAVAAMSQCRPKAKTKSGRVRSHSSPASANSGHAATCAIALAASGITYADNLHARQQQRSQEEQSVPVEHPRQRDAHGSGRGFHFRQLHLPYIRREHDARDVLVHCHPVGRL